jgi:hypothetical protein
MRLAENDGKYRGRKPGGSTPRPLRAAFILAASGGTTSVFIWGCRPSDSYPAFWLMHGVRAAIPRNNPLASGEFATIRERLKPTINRTGRVG